MIWRRRVTLMAVIGLAIAIPATILIASSGGDDEPASVPGIDEQLPLNPAVNDKHLDAAYSVPEGWSLKESDAGTLKLHSEDGSVQVGISSPGPAKDSAEILQAALASIRGRYQQVEVQRGSGKHVGGVPTKGAVVRARSDDVELGILVAVATGDKRAYLVEVFTNAEAPARPIAEAQRLLDSLRFKG
jgi:hypothetical protein